MRTSRLGETWRRKRDCGLRKPLVGSLPELRGNYKALERGAGQKKRPKLERINTINKKNHRVKIICYRPQESEEKKKAKEELMEARKKKGRLKGGGTKKFSNLSSLLLRVRNKAKKREKIQVKLIKNLQGGRKKRKGDLLLPQPDLQRVLWRDKDFGERTIEGKKNKEKGRSRKELTRPKEGRIQTI